MRGTAGFVHRRGLLLGAAALFLLLSLAYIFSIDIRASRGASITGDEPFYLLTTQSLIQDADLDLTNQYESRSYESFFDHPDGLWRQSVPLEDGRLLSPHNPGLSVLLIPGFALAGLVGAQVQLLLMAAGAMVLAFLLADRLTGHRAICWVLSLVVGLTATAFIYSTEIYPEFPAALVLMACLLIAMRRERLSWPEALMLVAGLSALCWLGVKYAPLVVLVAAWALWRLDRQGQTVLVIAGAVSSGVFVWWHLATFDSLTPYNVNTVYAGLSSVELVDLHAEFGDRVYRLWGLFIDRRFGIGRWAPILLLVVPALALLVSGRGSQRLLLGLIVAQILIATFIAITMMGWWFAGRTLLVVLPLSIVPLTLLVARSGSAVRWAMGILGAYTVILTAGLAHAGHTREVTIAVDPFDMAFPPFSVLSKAFPQYSAWGWDTWLLTIAWLIVAAGVTITVWRLYRGMEKTSHELETRDTAA